MYTGETKPLKDGLSYNPAEIYAGIYESKSAIYEQQQEAIMREQKALERERNEAGEQYAHYMTESYAADIQRTEYLATVKEAFVSACLYKLYKESSVTPLTGSDEIVARNLVNRFVKENGAGALINQFATKNYILSEFARICDKYYNKVLEGDGCCSEDQPETDELGFLIGRPVKLNNVIGTEFFEELEDVDCHDACKMIKDRVADSVSEFIDSNISARMDYEEVINAAKDQIDKPANEAYVEDIGNAAKRKIVEMEAARDKSVFHCIVESLTKSVFKDENLRKTYVKEAKVDMEKIVNSAQLMYTMLEMVNTTQIIEMDEAFISSYLDGIKN